MKKLIVGFAALLCLMACHKNTGNNPDAPGATGLITKIRVDNKAQTSVNEYAIEWNSDSTVKKIVVSGDDPQTITYDYALGYSRVVKTIATWSDNGRDSFVTDNTGRTTSRYSIYDGQLAAFSSQQYYTYNSSGQLTKTIIEANVQNLSDTLLHTWQSGDMVAQQGNSGNYDFTYSYDASKPAQLGDIPSLNKLINAGRIENDNAHLLTGATDLANGNTTASYTWDNIGRITKVLWIDNVGDSTIYNLEY